MPIQRVFSSRGFGTVVTGIPVGGQASVGDALEVVPLGKKGRVRGLHAYGEVTDLVRARHSSAVNITDIDYREVHRGMVLTQPGYFRSATMFEASFHYLPLNRRPLLHQAPVRVHVGTAEILGRVYLLEKKTLDPGEHSFVQFRLEAPLVAAPGDRYVVRAYSPLSTLGGGEILDRSRWRLKTGKGYVIDQLQEKADAVKDLNKFVTTATYSQGYDATTEADLARRVGLPPQELKTCVGELEGTGALCRSGRGGLILSQARLDEARSEVLRFAEQRFNESPRSRYLEQALLRQRLSAHEAFFQHLIQGLQQEGVITDTRDGRLAFRDYGPRLSATEATLKDDLTRALEGGGLSPPSPAELAATNDWSSDVTEELARLLVDEGEIVQLAEGVYLHRRSLEKARSAIQTHLESQGSMTASEAKNLLGSTRKYVIPLLEALDREGFTIRRGDVRELKQT
jgi:selenocysteine-specific elongation factor